MKIKAGRALHLPEQVEAGAGAQCQGLSDPSPCVCGHVVGFQQIFCVALPYRVNIFSLSLLIFTDSLIEL